MAVLNALRWTPNALLRNPILFVPVLIVMLFQVPQLVLQSVNPLLSSVLSLVTSLLFLIIMPFFQGGVIGMADEALDGHTSLRTFVADGKSNYVSILVAYLALMAVNFVLGMIGFFVAIGGGVLFLGSGGVESVNITVLAIVGGVVAIVVLLYLLLIFFAQFYGQAIVLEDLGAVDGFKRSLSVVRHNLVSTLGYTVLGGIVGGLAGLIFGAASILMSPQSAPMFHLPEPSFPIVVAVGFLVLIGGTLFGGFFTVFSVSFYRTVTEVQGESRSLSP